MSAALKPVRAPKPARAKAARPEFDFRATLLPLLRIHLPLASLVAGYVALFAGLSILKYRYFLYDDFDLALFTQALTGVFRGTTYMSIRGMSWLADHGSYVLFPLAVVYAIVRHPIALLVLQSLVLGLGAIPVHRMARRALAAGPEARTDPWPGGGIAALLFAAAYLLHPALGYLNLFEFHPEVIATTALLFAIDALALDRTRACLIWFGIALLAREDVAFVVAMVGVWAALVRRPRAPKLAGILAGSAIALLVITLVLVRPFWGSDAVQYERMYQQWGATPRVILEHTLGDPLEVLRAMIETPGDPVDTQLKRELLIHLLFPLAFLPLVSPLTLLVALPILLEHILSARTQQHTIVFQYAALLLPVIAWSASDGLRRLVLWRPVVARRTAAAALGCALLAQLMFGPIFGLGVLQTRAPLQRVFPNAQDRVLAPVRARMLAELPAGGDIVAGFEFLSRLAHRNDVHSLHHLLRGTYTYSNRHYPDPARVTAILADWSHPRLRPYAASPDAGRRIARLVARQGLVPVDAAGDVVLWARPSRGTKAIALVAARPGSATPEPRVHVDGALELLATEVAPHPEPGGRMVRIATRWWRVAPLDAVHLVWIEVTNEAGRVVCGRTHILGYVAWPPADWPMGTPMVENYRLVLDRPLPKGRYEVRGRIARLSARGAVPAEVRDADGLTPVGDFELGAFEVEAGPARAAAD